MISRGLGSFRGRRVLLLQSPVGPFFFRLARDLEWAGAQVCKINFNGGDALFYPSDAIAFRGTADEWPAFLRRVMIERDIDVVLLFGDCRPVHRLARQVVRQMGVELGVFEEGYVRPDYVTFERWGVNGNSTLPRSPIFYLNRDVDPVPEPMPVRDTFWWSALWAIAYYVAAVACTPLYPHYRHHRRLSLVELFPWLRSFARKRSYARSERPVGERLVGDLSGRFFLAPLQVHNDSQIQEHSGFTVERFIRYVVRSFASNAEEGAHLVFKHHPMDRGYHDYTVLLATLAEEYGLKGRLHYVHDLHLPTLLKHARGVVVVNSTVGLSALFHGRPLKTCGAAIYDIPGLTFRGSLKEFWSDAGEFEMDRELFRRFYRHLIATTQLNGSFYRKLDLPGSHSGLRWPHKRDRAAPAVPSSDAPDRSTELVPADVPADVSVVSPAGIEPASGS